MPTVHDPIQSIDAVSGDYDYQNYLTSTIGQFLMHVASNSRHPGFRFLVPSTIDGNAITDVEFRYYTNNFGGITITGDYLIERTNQTVAYQNNSANHPYWRFQNNSGVNGNTPTSFSWSTPSANNWGPDTAGGTGSESGWVSLGANTIADAVYAINNNGSHDTSGTYLSLVFDIDDGNLEQVQFQTDLAANPPELRITTAASSIAVDGESTSSSRVIIRPSYNVGRWYGADAPSYQSPVSAGSYGTFAGVTSGRWDIPWSTQYGQNITDVLYASPRSRVELNGNYPNIARHPNRKAIYFRNELLLYNSQAPQIEWNMWKHHPTKTSADTFDVWSCRFYYRPVIPTGAAWSDWLRAYNTDTNDIKVLIRSYGSTSTREIGYVIDNVSYGLSGDQAASGWNRVEIQASEYLDPKMTIRIYSEDSTTPLSTWTGNPTNVDARILRFGYRDYGTVGTDDHYLADFEVWDNYDLNGAFPSDPGVVTGGSPYVTPTNKWYYYDGVDIIPTNAKTVRAVSGGQPYFTEDAIPLSALEWHSALAGPDAGSFNPGVSDAFDSSSITGDATVVYENDTPSPPDGLTQYLQHTLTTANNDANAIVDLGTDYDKVYARMYFRQDASGTGSDSAILVGEDSTNAQQFTLAITAADWIEVRDGDNIGAINTLNISDSTWYRIEVYYNASAVSPPEQELLVRIFNEDGSSLLWSGTKDTSIRGPIRYLKFGPSVTAGASLSSYTCQTAGHAYDTVGWIGGNTVGYDVDDTELLYPHTFGSYRGNAIVYKEPQYAPIPSGDIPTPYSDISYGQGTGDTSRRKLDIHLPPGTPPAEGWPAIVWVHGGSWADGSKVEYAGIKDICLTYGYAFISIGYQLGSADNIFGLGNPPAYSLTDNSAGRMPTFILDVKQALHWIKNNAAADPYNININAIAGTGYSAGTYCIANAVYTRGLTSDASSWNWTLAANGSTPHTITGDTYYYEDNGQGDPDIIKCLYLFAPPVSPYLLYTWELDEGPGSAWYIPNRTGGLAYTTVRNMYANDANWATYASNHEMYDFIVGNPSAVVPTGATFGSADWFVTNDWHNQTGGYGQMPRLQQAFDDAVGLPANAELDIHVNSMNHDHVMADIEVEHFFNFIRKHL